MTTKISSTVSNITASDVGLGNVTNESKTTLFTNPTFSGSANDSKGEIRAVPINNQSTAYAIQSSDHGKCINTNSNVTLNASILTDGQNVTIYNNSAAPITITQGPSVTLYLVGTATTGSRTLSQKGLCTLFCVGTNTYICSGGGVS